MQKRTRTTAKAKSGTRAIQGASVGAPTLKPAIWKTFVSSCTKHGVNPNAYLNSLVKIQNQYFG